MLFLNFLAKSTTRCGSVSDLLSVVTFLSFCLRLANHSVVFQRWSPERAFLDFGKRTSDFVLNLIRLCACSELSSVCRSVGNI